MKAQRKSSQLCMVLKLCRSTLIFEKVAPADLTVFTGTTPNQSFMTTNSLETT